MSMPTLITDRTQEDYLRAVELSKKFISSTMTPEELEEYLGSLKGAYTHVDMNRVGEAVEFLSEYMDSIHTTLEDYLEENNVAYDLLFDIEWEPIQVSMKTDWAVQDRPTDEQLETYIQNVIAITGLILIQRDLPTSMYGLTIHGANEIERCILSEYSAGLSFEENKKYLIDQARVSWFFSGEIYSGEV